MSTSLNKSWYDQTDQTEDTISYMSTGTVSSVVNRTSWPELVGMNLFTARAVIQWCCSDHHIECYYYKKSKYRPRAPRFLYKDSEGRDLDDDTQRVVLWLDKFDCIALTPRIE